METITDIRPSPIAGQWYPGTKGRLAESVDNYLKAAQLPEIEGEIIAVMAPHAGYVYSGPVAGYAFAPLEGLSPVVVAVVSPMHHPHSSALLTSAHQAYQTPFGPIPVDHETVEELDEHLGGKLSASLEYIRNDSEHSLEIELPFLQRVFRHEFSLLPVMVRDQTPDIIRALGGALALTLKGRRAILVASTDLSHFYPQHIANELDSNFLRQVETLEPESVLKVEEQGKGFACGRGAVSAVMWAAKALGANHVQILKYATSGDVTGDHSQVVGYAAAVITRVNPPSD